MPNEVIDIRGSIGEPPNTAEQFTPRFRAAEMSGRPIELQLASTGGYVSDALAMYGSVAQSKSKTIARIEFVMSAATLLACACKEIQIVEDGLYLIHSARVTMSGTAQELRRQAGDIDRIDNMLASIYSRTTGKPVATVRAWMDRDQGEGTWFTSAEAKQNGLVHSILKGVYSKVSPIQARKTFKAEVARIAACAKSHAATHNWEFVVNYFKTHDGLNQQAAIRKAVAQFPDLHKAYLAEFNNHARSQQQREHNAAALRRKETAAKFYARQTAALPQGDNLHADEN